MKSKHWTPDKVFFLKEMWNSGSKTHEIADFLGPEFTRNMVIGKARRLNMPKSIHGPKERRKRALKKIADKFLRPKSSPIKVAPTPPVMTVVETPASPVPLLRAKDSHCRAIVGDRDGLALFCGTMVVPGTSWCRQHREIYFQLKK